MLQKVGTNVVRVHFGDDFWINRLDKEIQRLLKNGHKVVVSDVRFVREGMYVRSLGGKLVNVECVRSDCENEAGEISEVQVTDSHVSEVESLFIKCHTSLTNDKGKGKTDLYKNVDTLMVNLM